MIFMMILTKKTKLMIKLIPKRIQMGNGWKKYSFHLPRKKSPATASSNRTQQPSQGNNAKKPGSKPIGRPPGGKNSTKSTAASSSYYAGNSIGDLSKQLLQLSQTPPKHNLIASANRTAASSSSSSSSKAAVASSSGAGRNNNTNNNSDSKTMTEPANSNPWTPVELVALYGIHSKMDLAQPNFWELVSSRMEEQGIQRTAEECEYRWFLVRLFNST